MGFLGEWYRRVYYLLNRRRLDEELQREMEAHREQLGTPTRFGNTLRLREESQDLWGWSWLDDLWHDLRFGARQLRQSPVFTAAALLTLAIGIGGATLGAGLVKNRLFTYPPVREPQTLRQVVIGYDRRSVDPNRTDVSYPAFQEVRDKTLSFKDPVCLGATFPVNIGIRNASARGTARMVSGNYFQQVGIPLALGRPLTPDDDVVGSSTPAVVVSHEFWRESLGEDKSALGKTISVNGTPATIVGITPKGFSFWPDRAIDLTLPMALYPDVRKQADGLKDASQRVCQMLGRLNAGFSDQQAAEEVRQLLQPAPTAGAPPPRLQVRHVGRLLDALNFQNVDWLSVTGAIFVVGSVLLVACSNIAGMLLARASARRDEIATRLAIGAGRRRVVRQLLTESILLSGTGGFLGIFLGCAALKVVSPEIGFDPLVITLIAGISIATGIGVGLAPALSTTRIDLTTVMKQASQGSLGRLRLRAIKPLIAVQVALSLLLLVTSGLHVRSMLNMQADRAPRLDVVSFQADPRSNGFTNAETIRYYTNALAGLDTIPGVLSSSVMRTDFRAKTCWPDFSTSGYGNELRGPIGYVTPHYFEIEKLSISQGRGLEPTDTDSTPGVAVISESYARKVFAGVSPLGKTLGVSPIDQKDRSNCDPTAIRIVGVVSDAPGSSNDAPEIYLPFMQQADARAATFRLRVQARAAALVPAIRRTMLEFEPNIPIFGLDEGIENAEHQRKEGRVLVAALLFFGALTLLQACLGIYGTLAYAASRRTAEIGLRIAIGADRRQVVLMILREVLMPVLSGVGIGLLMAPFLAEIFSQNIYGELGPLDQWIIALSAAVMVLAAASAASMPAWRAARFDPMRALRYE